MVITAITTINKLAGYCDRSSAWLKIERSGVQILVILSTHCENELLT